MTGLGLENTFHKIQQDCAGQVRALWCRAMTHGRYHHQILHASEDPFVVSYQDGSVSPLNQDFFGPIDVVNGDGLGGIGHDYFYQLPGQGID